MPGEVDKLQVRIDASAEKATKAIDYLIAKLADLKRIAGPTATALHNVNSELREMSGLCRGFKSMGDPFAGFSRGAEKAAKRAKEMADAIRNANRETQKMAMTLYNAGGGAVGPANNLNPLGFARYPREEYLGPQGRLPGGSGNGQLLLEDFNLRDANVLETTFSTYAPSFRRATEEASHFEQTLQELWENASYIGETFKAFGTIAVKALSGVGKFALKVAGTSLKIVGKVLDSVYKRATRFLRSIIRIATYRAIRSALRELTQGFSQGIENLYLWSQAVGTVFAPRMDQLATSMLYLKNGFASMWSPLIEYFIPIIDKIVDKMVDAFNWVQRLFAQLTGKTTWYKAVKVQTQYKESTDATAKSVKALRQEIQLMDFDEINNLTDNPDNGTGTAAADVLNPNPAEMFTLEPTELEEMSGTLWENIKKKFSEWWDGFNWGEAGEKIGKKIREWVKDIDWKAIWEGVKKVAQALWDFVIGLLKGLFPWLFPTTEPDENKDEAWKSLHDIDDFLKSNPTQEEINQRIASIEQKVDEVTKDPRKGNEDVSGLYRDVYKNRNNLIGGVDTFEFLKQEDANFEAYVLYMEQLEKLAAAGGEGSGELYLETFLETVTGDQGLGGHFERAAQTTGELFGAEFENEMNAGAGGHFAAAGDAAGEILGEHIREKAEAATMSGWERIKSFFGLFKNGGWKDFMTGSNVGVGIGGYATGGYPTQGTLFYAGEGLPEMVGNINGRTGVASGAEITGIGDAVWSTGNTTANLLAEILAAVREKDLTIAPSASLGKVVTRSQKLYATQTG